MKSHCHIFDAVAQRRITSEEGAEWMMSERWRESYDRLYRVHSLIVLLNAVGWLIVALVHQ